MTNINKEIKWLLKEKYNNKPTKNFLKDVERLKKGEPLAYVIGFVEFLGCKIDLSKKPLIPRSETEFWVGAVIDDILTFSRMSECCEFKKIRALDIFSGSGCIGLAFLKKVKNTEVVFAEKDSKCLAQIRINLKINTSLIRANKGCTEEKRCVVVKSDVFSNVKGKYDYIFANPPYVSQKDIKKVQKSVLDYEPHQALFARRNGLFYIKKILKQAKNFLNPNGKIFMEFGSKQKKDIEKLLREYKYTKYKFHRDQYGKYRWVVIL